MKVKLLKGIKYGEGRYKAGETIEVDEETYGIFVGKGIIDGEGGYVGGGGGAGGKGKGGGSGAGEGAGTGGGGGADDNGGGAGDGDIGGLDGMTRIELMDYLKGAGIEFDTRDDKATLLGLAKKG